MGETTGKLVLALDTGTTSGRALVIDASGAVLASAQQEAGLSTPRPGWVEQDAEALWQAQLATARGALEKAGVRPRTSPASASPTSARRRSCGTGPRRQPVAPAIVWQDRRTADFCEELRGAGAEALVRRKTGLLLDPYFSGTKLRWLLENVPGVRERAEAGELAFGTVDSWMAWRLSGGRRHVTDATNASRTLLYDIREGAWDDELLALFGVPRALLPEVVDSSGVVGETDPALLGAAVPIAGMAGDQQAALFGQACTRRGMIKVTYGTGCFLLLNTGDEAPSAPPGLVSTVALQRDGRRTYALEGSVFIGGAAVQWLRDGLGIVGSGAGGQHARAERAVERRRRVRAGARRARRAALGPLRARRHLRAHARDHGGAHRPRHAGGHRLPGRRPVPGRGRRRRGAARGGARRRRRGGQRPAAAVPGRPPRRAGHPGGPARGDRLRRRLAGRPGDRRVGERGRGRRALERRRRPSRRRPRPTPATCAGAGRRR